MNSKLLALLLFLLVSALNVTAAFRAAIAVRNVTPDPLLPVSGGVGPSHKTTQKEGELTVRALVLEQEGTRVAIVSADFLGFPAALGNRAEALRVYERCRALLAKELGTDPSPETQTVHREIRSMKGSAPP